MDKKKSVEEIIEEYKLNSINRTNVDIWLKAINDNHIPDILEKAGRDIRNNPDIIYDALKIPPHESFKYAGEDLKKDKEFILSLFTHFYGLNAFKYINKDLKKDKNFIIEAVKFRKSIEFFDYIDEDLKNDVDVLNAAINKNSSTSVLKKAGKKFKCNKKDILEFLKNTDDYYCIRYIDKNLLKDKEYCTELLNISPASTLKFCCDELKDDKDFVMKAIKMNPCTLEFASDRLKKDKEVALTAVRGNYDALAYVDKNLSNDKSISCFYAIREDLLEKLKKKYYKSYMDKIVSKDKSKDNDMDFYMTMINSNVLEKIYSSNDFSIEDTRSIESSLDLFDNDERELIKKRIDNVVKKNRDSIVYLFNFIVTNKRDKDKIKAFLSSIDLNEDNVVNYILNNKYLDKVNKTAILNIIYSVYDFKNVIRVNDIFSLLEEMNERKMTIDEILSEKNFDKKMFKRIYDEAREQNPVLFQYIKESLEINRMRGTKKYIKRGYAILRNNSSNISEYETEYNSSIYDLINDYKGTEFYDKFIEKFSKLDDFDSSKLNVKESEKVL